MTLSQILACGLLGLITAWGVSRFIQRLSFLANKGERSAQFHHSGDTPIPRFGGVALAGAFVVVSLVVCVWRSLEPLQNRTYVTILLSSLAMFGVGLWDDFRPLGARRKLLLQVLIAGLVYWCGVQIQTFKNPLNGVAYSLGPWGYAAT